MSEKNIHLTLVCPCCGGEVTHQRYGFIVLTSPANFATWHVCDTCESALNGNDPAARHAAEQAFLAFLEKQPDAPAAE
jgi:hypothetical protein